jgi:H+/Cl- antiporter ClcA
MAAGIGIGAGIIAFLLVRLISVFTNLFFFHQFSLQFRSPLANQLGYWVVLLPAAGGIIVGLMAKYGSPKIKGHGIPEAMEAVLLSRSRIQPKVAILKPLSAALAIGTGGPFGVEGPIIQTGGAVGSIIGQMVQMTAAERKTLLACGAGAGMSATFNTPLAGVILAIELLLFEFKARSFIPLVIASTLATATRYQLLGAGAMFQMGQVDFGIPANLLFYVVLGVVCGLAAVAFTRALYWTEDQFARLPVNDLWWPAIGGLVLGAIGFFVPRVLGVGYDTISDILAGRLAAGLLVTVMIAKSVALMVSLGSGTSGGLLAPMFMTSAALGAVFATAANHLFPGARLEPSAFALVAMGAVFGAAARAPFTFIIFAFEITRDYNAVLPLMLVGVIATAVARLLSRRSIMTEKLARRGLHVEQEYETDVFQHLPVEEVMDRDPVVIPQDMKLAALAEKMARDDPDVTRHQGVLIADETGRLAGILTRGDVVRVMRRGDVNHATVLEAANPAVVVAYPDEPLHEAITRMVENEVGRLPVVTRADPRRVIGYLGRPALLRALLRRHEDEHVREPGWLSRGRGIAAKRVA